MLHRAGRLRGPLLRALQRQDRQHGQDHHSCASHIKRHGSPAIINQVTDQHRSEDRAEARHSQSHAHSCATQAEGVGLRGDGIHARHTTIEQHANGHTRDEHQRWEAHATDERDQHHGSHAAETNQHRPRGKPRGQQTKRQRTNRSTEHQHNAAQHRLLGVQAGLLQELRRPLAREVET